MVVIDVQRVQVHEIANRCRERSRERVVREGANERQKVCVSMRDSRLLPAARTLSSS